MKTIYKRITSIIILSILMMTCRLQNNYVETQASSKGELKKILQSTTSEKICKFIVKDFNKDGNEEAIGITSSLIDELGYADSQIWYVTDSGCTKLDYNDDMAIYPKSIKIYTLKDTCIFTFSSGAGGSGWNSYAFSFDESGAIKIDNIAYGIQYLGKNQFSITDSQYDGATDGTGHTWNTYYSRWDGKKLVEYGGLSISQSQLKRAKNGASILKKISKKGKIGKIFYRANGLIFINYRTGGYQNNNVALKLKNGKVSYYAQSDYGDTKLDRATQAGVIHKSITSCVQYPKSFPLK